MTFAFFNFNSYLGGGETLIVRLAEYLQEYKYSFKIFYKKGSYIEKDLWRVGIDTKSLCPIISDVSYYYLNNHRRKLLREEILKYLQGEEDVCLVSLNLRELYTLFSLAKIRPSFRLAHVVLHNQDNLYVCQSICDKIRMKLGGGRHFSLKNQINFNRNLFNILCEQSIVIPQSEIQSDLMLNEYGIKLEKKNVVPLPACDFSRIGHHIPENSKKVLWIGRIVDFKIPALISIVRFVSRRPDYSLTIVGDGDISFVKNYIKDNKLVEENIIFLGKVDYSDLEGIIKQHAIGYAMGTSIVEIGKYGLPIIMALGAPDFKLFEEDICGGLYFHQSRGNVGDTLYYKKSNDPVLSIEDAFKELENNFIQSSKKCYEELKANFDENINFQLYLQLLSQAQRVKSSLSIPKASLFRSIAFNVFRKSHD